MIFEIRVSGVLGPAAQQAFDGLLLDVERAELDAEGAPGPLTTVIIGDLDQAALHGVMDRVWALGLELIDIRRVG